LAGFLILAGHKYDCPDDNSEDQQGQYEKSHRAEIVTQLSDYKGFRQ
jgi:hypothetical protein